MLLELIKRSEPELNNRCKHSGVKLCRVSYFKAGRHAELDVYFSSLIWFCNVLANVHSTLDVLSHMVSIFVQTQAIQLFDAEATG